MNGQVLVCAFTHASARGQHRDFPATPYFNEVVKPTHRKALRHMDRRHR